ncbi:unnamed protein product [Microthlaspi erraticum]|uniref:BTB domain-containing protein n=1 Tax=Microthlaspi erraticum TaxID=1685480 RepID=A0A6D2HRD0_9BRAS|nr:unnamed protein product [Microthlaspi erraticum]
MATQSNKDAFMGGLMNLFKEQWQADVLLKAGDSDDGAAIPAHKLVLAGRSEVFKDMVEQGEFKASSKLETITLSEMKHGEVEALVEFMYSVDGSISCRSLGKHGRSLYLAADKYKILHLRDLCRHHLIQSLDSSNALSIIELAQIPFDKDLHDAAFAAINNNLRPIASSDEFKLFVEKYPNLTVEIMKASLTWEASPNHIHLGGNRYCGHCGSYCRFCGYPND